MSLHTDICICHKCSCKFLPDGLLLTCSYDYYTDDLNRLSYCFFAFVNHYLVPLVAILYFYGHIVKAVFLHEKNMKLQAKKMNTTDLRSSVN